MSLITFTFLKSCLALSIQTQTLPLFSTPSTLDVVQILADYTLNTTGYPFAWANASGQVER